MEPVKKKKGRPPADKAPEKLSPSLKLTLEADVLLAAQAKKFKISKREYASAAVKFVAATGLDPRKESPASMAAVGQKIEAGVASVRAHNADIGNRLFALTRGFEKTMYLFMQQQEHNMNVYLEGIEANIMKRLVSMEDNILLPLIERVLRGNQDAYMSRGIGIRIYQKLLEDPPSWSDQDKALTGEREQVLLEELKGYMTSHKIPPANSTRRPAATPVPPKPVAPAAAPAPTSAATPPKP
jgi:hypothetical protein